MPPSPRNRTRDARGSTLLGVALAIGALSLGLAVALPFARGWLVRTRARAVVADLRAFATAFQSYAAEHGDWPEGDGTPGAIPAGMQRYLGATRWQQRTPIGGRYAWDPNSVHQGSRYRAAIVITATPDNAVSRDAVQLRQIDRAIDDGNLASGVFQLGFRQCPLYVLEH